MPTLNRKTFTQTVSTLSERDLDRLIAVANAEKRERLARGHREYVLKHLHCPRADHFRCKQLIAGIKARGLA